MITAEALRRTVAAIRQQPDLNGCIIGLQANGSSRVLDPGLSGENFTRRYVIVEEVSVPGQGAVPSVQVIQRAARGPAVPAPATPQPAAEAVQRATRNASRVNAELTGMQLACGAMALSGAIAIAGSATGIGALAWIGFAASAASCVNATLRYQQAGNNPDSDSLYRLDRNGYYVATTLLVDAIGVGSGLVGGAQGIVHLLQLRGGLAAINSAYTAQAINAAIRTTLARGGCEALLNEMRIAGFSGRAAAGSILTTRSAAAAPSETGVQRLFTALTQTIVGSGPALSDLASGLGGFLISGGPSDRIGAASGSVNWAATTILVHNVNRPQGN
ncbi:hypothetical protein [Paludibaculum fermentans]|uniref:hypothetical protein n=1 Tax=Paludibaculum fermentans TaxID=1473598 RepID=UPI003EBEFEE0